MIRSFLLTAALTLCWTLSPDSLVLLGHGFGKHGLPFGLALLAGALLSVVAASVIQHPASRELSGARAMALATFNIAGRLSPALLLPTGMLVTAGFTFNETFVFWFPNFGFSYLLLFVVVLVHLGGERVVLAVQQVLVLVTAGCLLLLALTGLLTEPPPNLPAAPSEATSTFLLLAPVAMLLFLGYDQPVSMAGKEGRRYLYFCAAVATGWALLTLFGAASLLHAPSMRLAESSVPYAVGARAILGQPGRLIMGIAIISGAGGAVNGLFYLAVRTVRPLLPEISGQTPNHDAWPAKIQAMLMASVIALSMALGLAGSENLKVYIFGALLLWLLSAGAHCLAAASFLHQQHKRYFPLGYATGGPILAAVAYLALTYPQPRLLVAFCLPVLAASAVFSVLRYRFGKPAINNKGDSI